MVPIRSLTCAPHRAPASWPNLDGCSVDEQIASVRIWYHTLELAGRETPGYFDMRPTVAAYGIPEDLTGERVLDVGASNGFFSFLFERRGAERVVAYDLGAFRDHDYPPWFLERELARRTTAEIERTDWDELHGGFLVAHRILGSRVERVLGRVYDLARHLAEARFDLVFCSNVLVHLRDPIGALIAIREVLEPGGRAILATPVVEHAEARASAAQLAARVSECTWWVPTPVALARMCEAAGLAKVEIRPSFELSRVRGAPHTARIGVVRCERPR